MSSLAAARADNFYFPPDDAYKVRSPRACGSPAAQGPAALCQALQQSEETDQCLAGLQLRTQHPLRERAKKMDQGILVIRFEMPFNVFCACGKLIGKVRVCPCVSLPHQGRALLLSS